MFRSVLMADSRLLLGLHAAIEREIRLLGQRIDELRDRESDYLIVDDCCDQTEELLGLAFVAAQGFITSVKAHVKRLPSQLGKPISIAIGPSILKLVPAPGNGKYTAVEVINGVANFWKHREEWSTKEESHSGRIRTVWCTDNGHSKATITLVTEIGLSAGSTGNLRKAAELLGVASSFSDLNPIRTALSEWAHAVYHRVLCEICEPTS